MKLSIKTNTILTPLVIASGYVANNSTLPILKNLHMKAESNKLIIRATDMEKFFDITLPCEVIED